MKGFTLLELIIVLALLGILAAVYLVTFKPAVMFSSARNSQRVNNLDSIAAGLQSWQVDGGSILDITANNSNPIRHCDDGHNLIAVNGDDNVDLINELVPDFLSEFPIDPLFDQEDKEVSGYALCSADFYIHLSAPSTEFTSPYTLLVHEL